MTPLHNKENEQNDKYMSEEVKIGDKVKTVCGKYGLIRYVGEVVNLRVEHLYDGMQSNMMDMLQRINWLRKNKSV